MTNKLPPGKYKHYKGKEYEVLGTAYHTETLEELVVYKSLYDASDYPKDTLWVRPLKMFCEQVEHNGVLLPRFSKN